MIRRAIGVAIGMVLAFGIYLWAKHTVSQRMLAKALEVPTMIGIAEADLPEAEAIITRAHDAAFGKAFTTESLMGKGFEGKAYKNELFKQAVTEAQRRGRQDLATAFQNGQEQIVVGIGGS